MNKRHLVMGWLILALPLVLLVGCLGVQQEVAPPATEGARTPEKVLAARRAVLAFLREGANECVPPPGVIWEAKPGMEPDGFEVHRFDSEGCLMTISYPLPEAESTLYHVTLHNSVTGFCWQANVDVEGEIVGTGTAAGMLPELSNAAAAYCKEQGYTYEEQDQSDGVRCGLCVFDGGASCNAWAYFQGMCGPEGSQ